LGQARCALELLLCGDLAQARLQANYLHQLNRQRQALEEAVLKEAAVMVRREKLSQRAVMVLAQEGWHLGVLGIVAARLAEEYHRPVALVSLKNGSGRGSARSVEGFHLFQGLQACQELLSRYGGHAAAAGFEVAAENLAPLQEKLEQAFEEQVGADSCLHPTLKVDAQVELAELNREFFGHLERLRPFGPGNPAPVFVCREVECLGSRVVAERHLKVQLHHRNCVMEAIAFGQAAHHPLTGVQEVAFSTGLSYYQGRTIPELLLLDWGGP
jgi:single-stranded-DNA-specific exonuclease